MKGFLSGSVMPEQSLPLDFTESTDTIKQWWWEAALWHTHMKSFEASLSNSLHRLMEHNVPGKLRRDSGQGLPLWYHQISRPQIILVCSLPQTAWCALLWPVIAVVCGKCPWPCRAPSSSSIVLLVVNHWRHNGIFLHKYFGVFSQTKPIKLGKLPGLQLWQNVVSALYVGSSPLNWQDW